MGTGRKARVAVAEIAHEAALGFSGRNGQGQAAPARVIAIDPKTFAPGPLAFLAVNGPTLRIVASLLSINVASRLLSGLSILISVWLFAPAEFARFGALLAALTLASAVQFLRYESTIVSANSAAGLRSALRLSAAVGALVWCAMAGLAWVAVAFGLVGIDLACLFLLALAGRAVCRLVGRIVVRNGDFDLLGRTTLTLAAVQPIVVLLAFCFGSNGTVAMALTDILGNLAAGIYLVIRCRGTLRDALSVRDGDPGLWRLARDWSALPLVNLPSTALAVAFTALPLLIVLGMAETHVAGHIALAFRLLDVPAQILAAAISPIAMNRFTSHQTWQLKGCDPALVFWLLLAVVGVFGAVSLGAALIEPRLAGTPWQGLSLYLPLVALFQAGVAFALPLIDVAGLRRNQRDLFIVQALAMAGVVIIALVVGNWHMALLGFGVIAAIRATCLALPLLLPHQPRTTV
jgi:hypothetical protein